MLFLPALSVFVFRGLAFHIEADKVHHVCDSACARAPGEELQHVRICSVGEPLAPDLLAVRTSIRIDLFAGRTSFLSV